MIFHYKYVLALFLIGCTPKVSQVEIAQPLPSSPPINSAQILHQKHFYTPQDHHRQMYDLNLNSYKTFEDLDNLQVYYLPYLAEDTRTIIHTLLDKMNNAVNEEEFVYYHRMYNEALKITEQLKHFYTLERLRINIVNDEIFE